MPRLTRKLPSYRLHKASGQALVCLDGHRIYLGPYDSPASRAEYDRLVGEWLAHQRRRPAQAGMSVDELILAYWKFAESHYTRDGRTTRHLDNLRDALRPVRRLYGHAPAAEFGPAALRATRRAMVDADLCRNTVNGRIGKIRSMFKWAVREELVPAEVLTRLQSVEAIRPGRDGVRETEKVKPVPDEHVEAVLPSLPPPVRAMVELQRVSGMRPGEAVAMTTGEVDRSSDVWVYRPRRHKTMDHGVDRAIMLGPKAQEVLRPWLKDDPDEYLFSPIAAVEARDARKRVARRTPMTPSQARRRRKASPSRAPGARYSKNAYAEAIVRACRKAGVPPWRPNRLRHALATKVERDFDLRAAQVVLGHKSIRTTEVYVKGGPDRARDVMAEIG